MRDSDLSLLASDALQVPFYSYLAGGQHPDGKFDWMMGKGHRDFLEDPSKRKVLTAGNRCGKSTLAAWIVAKRLLTEEVNARFVSTNSKQIRSPDGPGQIVDWFLKPWYASNSAFNVNNGFRNNVVRLRCNRSVLEVKTSEDDPGAHASSNMDLIWIDEPTTAPILRESEARVRSKMGDIMMTLTCVNGGTSGFGWLKDKVLAPQTDWVHHKIAFTPDNVPWLPAAYVLAERDKAMRDDPSMFPVVMDGEWEAISGLRRFTHFTDDCLIRYSQFLSSRSDLRFEVTCDWSETADRNVILLLAVDEGRQRAVVVGESRNHVRPDGRKHAQTPDEDADQILELLSEHDVDPLSVRRITGDVNSAGKGAGGRSVNEMVSEALGRKLGRRHNMPDNLRVVPASKTNVYDGEHRVNLGFSTGNLFVTDNCEHLRQSLGVYEHGKQAGKDACDALRYGLDRHLASWLKNRLARRQRALVTR